LAYSIGRSVKTVFDAETTIIGVGRPGGPNSDVVYRRRPTAEVDSGELVAIRELLHTAFGDNFTQEDWDHALGGVHVTAHIGSELVGHGAVVSRQFVHGERVLRTGYVEAVAVHPDHHSAGIGRGLMGNIEDLIDDAYDLGALSATGSALTFYKHLGWEPWAGPTHVSGPNGVIPTPDDDGAVFVRRVDSTLPLTGPLICDWREGDVW